MPGCQRRQKQNIKEDATRTWYQNLKRRVQEVEKKRKNNSQKNEKRMDKHGIRKY